MRNGAASRCRAIPFNANAIGSRRPNGAGRAPGTRCWAYGMIPRAARPVSTPSCFPRTRHGWATIACSTGWSRPARFMAPWPRPPALRGRPRRGGRRGFPDAHCACFSGDGRWGRKRRRRRAPAGAAGWRRRRNVAPRPHPQSRRRRRRLDAARRGPGIDGPRIRGARRRCDPGSGTDEGRSGAGGTRGLLPRQGRSRDRSRPVLPNAAGALVAPGRRPWARYPFRSPSGRSGLDIHPLLLDGCFQVMAAARAQGGSDEAVTLTCPSGGSASRCRSVCRIDCFAMCA